MVSIHLQMLVYLYLNNSLSAVLNLLLMLRLILAHRLKRQPVPYLIEEGHELRQNLLLVRQGALEAFYAILEQDLDVGVHQAFDLGVYEGT